MKSRKRILTFIFVVFALLQMGADCDGNVIDDPTFRQWCGDSLCAWQLDAGHIAKAPTWNAIDYGISFLDTPTQISQVSAESEAKCLVFTSVADIDPAAQVSIQVDFDADGTIEFSSPLGASQWHQVKAEVTAPDAYKGIRFILRKEGSGRAVLAEMRVQSSSGCTAPAPTLNKLQLGEVCGSNGECETGICAGDNSTSAVRLCSECTAQHACPNGETCSATHLVSTGIFAASVVNQCEPGKGLGRTNAPCFDGSDCASTLCIGTSFGGKVDDAGDCTSGDCYPIGGHCQ